VRPRDCSDLAPALVLPPFLERFLKGLKERPQLVPSGLLESLIEWARHEEVHPIAHPPAVIEVPLFLHFMTGSGSKPAFDSGPLAPGAVFEVPFGAEATYGYHCSIHPNMQAKVTVAMGGPALATVNILSTPDMKFDPASVTVAPGGKVRWTNVGPLTHTV